MTRDESEIQAAHDDHLSPTREVARPRLAHMPLPKRWTVNAALGMYEHAYGGALEINDETDDAELHEALIFARDSVALLQWETWERAVRAQEVSP